MRWHRVGDIEGLLAGRGEVLASNRDQRPANLLGDHLQLGELNLFLGRREEVLEHFREAWRWARAHLRWALVAEALRANLEGEADAFSKLLARAGAWQNTPFEDRLWSLWAKTLREKGEPYKALELLKGREGFWASLERGRRTEALRRYRIFAEHLKKDVGLEPLLETRRIVQSWPGDFPRLTQDY